MGEDVVIYRTRSGRAHVIRPYCPHLGAHLGCGGRVEDDLIVCPFHSFAFSGDGSVARVGPGHTARHVRDKLTVLPCEETNGGIFTWAGTDRDQPPSWAIPNLFPTATPALRLSRTEVGTHPQEILENNVDTTHLYPLHGFRECAVLEGPASDGTRSPSRSAPRGLSPCSERSGATPQSPSTVWA